MSSRRSCSSSARHAEHRFETAVDIGLRGRPRGDADAHGGAGLPDGAAAPARAVLLNACDYALCLLGCAERDEHLVELHIVQNLEARGGEAICETLRAAA